MVLGTKTINPYLFINEIGSYTLVYIPYRHNFRLFSHNEWQKVKNLNLNKEETKQLEDARIIVDSSYAKKFIKHYKSLIKKPELNLIYLLLTDSCNLNCPYCFIENNYSTAKRSFMDFETAKKSIDYFLKKAKGNEFKIIFYGGEPTLNKEVLIKSLNYIRRTQPKGKNIQIGVNTNGLVYDRGLSKAFKKNDAIVSISLDSFPELNDYTRIDSNGNGVSDVVIKNIKRYILDGVFVSLSITINAYNIDYLPAFAKYIIQEFPSVKSVGFNLPLQHLKSNKLFVDPEYCAFQVYNSFRIFRAYGVYEDRVLRRLRHIIEENVYLKDCGACGNQIAVSPDGFVGPCHGFVGMKKDFVKFDEKYDFYNNKIIKKWNTYSPINKPACIKENCPFLLICGNSCPYYSFIASKKLDFKDERMCKFLPVLIREFGKDVTLNTKIKYIFIDYDGVIMSRKPSFDILTEIKSKLKSSYHLEKQSYYDIREIITSLVNHSSYPKEKIDDVIYLYLKMWKKESTFNNPLINQLKEIKDKFRSLKIYIITNSEKEQILKELNKEVLKLFDEIYGKDNLPFKKSDKGFVHKLLTYLKIKNYEVFYIGDSYEDDIKPFLDEGVRAAVSFYCNPHIFHRTSNNWLDDIFEDVAKNDRVKK